MLLSGNMSFFRALAYWPSQIVGGFCGSLLARAALPEAVWNVNWGGCTIPIDSLSAAQGIVIEAALTFLLVNAVLMTAVDTSKNIFAPFCIGLTLFVDIIIG